MLKSKYWLIPLLLIPIILTNCAKRGTITGGPKDTLAPVMTSSNPANFSKNFKGNTIKLNFDEYIKLKDAQKQIIVSPPLKNNLVITPNGAASKFINISFKDTLQDNTTYTINFGQSIEDNNEGNPYTAFKYVFSTGDYIDSLKFKGKVTDALSKTVDKNISVMLYPVENFSDSTIYKKTPLYITNTLEYGSDFEIDNIKNGAYYAIALKDENKNNKFDPKVDKIGFYPKIINIPNDTLFTLDLFKEEVEFEPKKIVQQSQNKLTLGLNTPNYENLKVEAQLNNKSISSRITKFADKDSIMLWLPKLDFKDDSLQVVISKDSKDFNQKLKLKNFKSTDTLTIGLQKSVGIDFRESFKIKINTPIENVDINKITLINKDSTKVDFNIEVKKLENLIDFNFKTNEEEQYHLTLHPGAITDFYGQKNDTLKTILSTKKYSDYGNLKLIINNAKSKNYIVQLLDDKEVVKYEMVSIENTNEYYFTNITPYKYNVRIIYDVDRNKKWTPGNYLKKRLPEEVIYFPELIDVRANWEVNQPIDL